MLCGAPVGATVPVDSTRVVSCHYDNLVSSVLNLLLLETSLLCLVVI